MVLKDRYCIIEQIGKGGSGSVYLARDMELGVLRAVKELPVSEKKEARFMAVLEHHSFPKIIDYAENNQYCYIIMELINGESLGESLRKGTAFSIKEVLKYGIILTQVLGYLHGRKPPVFYGDLKPDNVMVSKCGKVYLVDFGSASAGYRNEQRICIGTEGFAAPEQYEGRMSIASDVYGLGRTLETLLGRRRKWLRLFCPKLAFVLWKCCRKKETERYQDMEILEKKLRKIQKGISEDRIAAVLAAGLLVFGVAAVLLFGREQKADFYEELTAVTDLYYREEFLKNSTDKRKQIGKEAEKMLQELSRQYRNREEQRVILKLLAMNSEYEGDGERAAFYYEQMILYDESFREGYGEYGMFLLRTGQGKASEELWEDYAQKEKRGELEQGFSRNLKLWETWMEGKNEKNGKGTEGFYEN